MLVSLFFLVVFGLLFHPTVQQEEDCFCLAELQSAVGLRSPTAIVFAPDGSGRFFIAEQKGLIWVFDDESNKLPEPFLDISGIVSSDGDRGLLSFAFHPDFATNQKLYLHYTWLNESHVSRLSEIQASASDPNVADMSTERILIDLGQIDAYHHGGGILFGPDGYLYVAEGDGSAPGDHINQGQDLTVLRGKILRIDVNTGTGPYEYGIPPDNPFLDNPDASPEIYAYGIRNPYRISMDTGDRETGDGLGRIFIGDVGDSTWEEIDILEAGGNFGWSCKEGFADFEMSRCPGGVVPNEVLPILSYNHADVGFSVIGGNVYRGLESPAFDGWYFFGDYTVGSVFQMVEPSPAVYEWKQIFTCSANCAEPLTNEHGRYVISFGQDFDGEVYMMSTEEYSAEHPGGRVFKIVQDPGAK